MKCLLLLLTETLIINPGLLASCAISLWPQSERRSLPAKNKSGIFCSVSSFTSLTIFVFVSSSMIKCKKHSPKNIRKVFGWSCGECWPSTVPCASLLTYRFIGFFLAADGFPPASAPQSLSLRVAGLATFSLSGEG